MSIIISNMDIPYGCQKCKFFKKHLLGDGWLDYSYSCILGAKDFPMPWIRQLDERASDCPIKQSEQEPKIGHWIEENINEWSRKIFCSECGCPPPFEYVSTSDVYSASGYGVVNKTKFCPNCGARMETEE